MARGGKQPGAGRPKGGVASHTLLATKTKEAFVAAVHDNLQELFNSLLTEAKKGNMVALKELLDRAWGRPTQPIAGDKEHPIEINITGMTITKDVT